MSAMGYFIETYTTTLLLVEYPLFTTEPCVKKAEVIRDINAKRFFRVFHVGRNRVLWIIGKYMIVWRTSKYVDSIFFVAN